MRIMHLSDLHLGRNILEQSLIDDQKYILDELLKMVVEEKVDIVLICGDVYDKSIPCIDAVNLFSDFLTRLHKNNVKVFVISGNHDSKDRLCFGNELFIDNGIFIEGVFNGKLRCIELDDEYGRLNIYMLPFVKPIDVKKYFSDEYINSYDDAVRCIIKNTRINKDERNIIMLHQFVTGRNIEIERSESETISLGGIDNVNVNIFKDFDYVAMGHIHGPQKLQSDTIRYAGSPLEYSFSEVNQKKSVPIIDYKEKFNINVNLIKILPKRDMRVIKGPIDKLLDKDVYDGTNLDDYICAVVTDNDYIIDAIGKLRNVYNNILKIEYDNDRTVINNSNISDTGDVNINMSPNELFKNFYEEQNNIELSNEYIKVIDSVIGEVFDEVN